MDYILLFIVLVNIAIVIGFLIIDRIQYKRDIVHPITISLAMSLLGAISSLYYTFNADVLYDYFPVGGVYSREVLEKVFLIHIYVNVVLYISFVVLSKLFFGSLNPNLNFTFPSIFDCKKSSLLIPFIVYLFSAFCLLYLILQIGGIAYLWSNIGSRQDTLASHGYLMTFSQFSLQLFGLILFLRCVNHRRLICAFLITILTIVLLGLLGARLPMFAFLFLILLGYHYSVSKIRFRLSYFAILAFALYGAVYMGELRKPSSYELFEKDKSSYLAHVSDSFFGHLREYTTRVRRDVVVVDHFERNEFWYGKSYLSVLLAPIPRSIYPDKPPNDTGRYIVAMYHGQHVAPPMATHELPNYGWPDRFMAGYVNFSYFGIALLTLLSVAFILYLYRIVTFSPNAITIFFYGTFIFRGVTYLEPMAIVSILTNLVFALVFMIIFAFSQLFLKK